MGKKKKKVKKRYGKINIKKIILIILLCLLIKCVFFTNSNNANKETVLIIGEEKVQLTDKIVIDSLDNIYISYEDIKNLYDENIYYDEANKKLVTTYNKHVAVLELDDKKIIINDAESEIKGNLCIIENKVYLPFSDMEIVYDIESKFDRNSNTVIVDSISKEKKITNPNKKVKIKKSKNIFSKTLTKENSNSELTVFKEEGKYLKVRNQSGKIGYVKSKKVNEVKTIRNNMDEEKFENINILKKYSEISDNYEKIDVDSKKYNVVAPNVLKIVENKNVEKSISNNEKYQKYIKWVEENNINLWATITNDVEVSEILLTYENRNTVINNIYTKLVENNYKVLNINFEKINDINSFYRFIIELTPRLRESGIKTVVTYNNNINIEKIENIVDYIVKEE